MIAATASGVDRERSVSSMRSKNLPPWWRAKSQLNSAVRALPICRNPVGEGAKRTTGVIAMALTQVGQAMVLEHFAQAGLHQLAGRAAGGIVIAAPQPAGAARPSAGEVSR